jgi:outer membrane protein TolC
MAGCGGQAAVNRARLPGSEFCVSRPLERRPDIAAAERRMAAANEQIGIAQAAYYPTLNLAAAAGLEGSSLLNWFNWPSRFWAVGPGMSEMLFDGGRRRATRESARAGYDASVANYRQTVLTSFQQVEDNLVVLRVLSTESTQQHEATTSAEDSLRLFQNRYAGRRRYLSPGGDFANDCSGK